MSRQVALHVTPPRYPAEMNRLKVVQPRRTPVKPHVPAAPPNDGLGMGADGNGTNGKPMAPLGDYHQDQTQTLLRVGGMPPKKMEWLVFWGCVALLGLLVVVKLIW